MCRCGSWHRKGKSRLGLLHTVLRNSAWRTRSAYVETRGGQEATAAVKKQRRRSRSNGGGHEETDLHRCQVSLLASERRRSSVRNSSKDRYSSLCASRST